MPWIETLIPSKKSSGSRRETHVSASRPSKNVTAPAWRMLATSALAVSTSSATKSLAVG
jgi:hypothetical protein